MQSSHYLFYAPVALLFSWAAAFLFRIIFALPALLKSWLANHSSRSLFSTCSPLGKMDPPRYAEALKSLRSPGYVAIEGEAPELPRVRRDKPAESTLDSW